MNATRSATETPPPAAHGVAAAAAWFLSQKTLPRHQTVALFANDFTRYLERLIPQIEQMAAAHPDDAAQAVAARAGVDEALQRLSLAHRPGLNGEVERVKRLARSVVALRTHYEKLGGRP
ncbi:DUF6415 family natural product biosynthesis protein [Streptomyces sp. A012304]|uniref:DUF6415 family natural product biosynthesis protein n=1 Tax=Streptomyces sp. A012304 TaxID=375446 RepID=UPI00222FFB21|nr:DUF6415 family natural product biosynthesis protein [Streptomyces sp. A012304]GKQ39436.1 hypothetical protein ALMP_59630 [Streptomyces sp. A012304]